MKKEPTEWEKIFASHLSDKELYLDYLKNTYNSVRKDK